MSGDTLLSAIAIAAALSSALLAFITNRRAAATKDKKLTFEEQIAANTASNLVSTERREELERLYGRVEKLEQIVEDLQRRDVVKQATIDKQADELDRTNRALAEVKRTFARYTKRVEDAWTAEHSMPALTGEELKLLEDTLPVRSVNKMKGTHK